jgi:hypothetical protein
MLGYILGDFFTISSGHPDALAAYPPPEQKIMGSNLARVLGF